MYQFKNIFGGLGMENVGIFNGMVGRFDILYILFFYT
jgi:hypothetical protein